MRFFNSNGEVDSVIDVKAPPHCLLVSGDDEVIVGTARELAVYDFNGIEKWRSPRLPERTYLTSIAASDEAFYLADAGNREILICNRKNGEIVSRFGKKDVVKNNPGFSIPSPYFDLAIAEDGQLRVANPGRLRPAMTFRPVLTSALLIP